MNKTLFVDDSTEKVELGDGFWIEIPKEIGYAQSEEIFGNIDREKTNDMQVGKKMIIALIKKWNLTEKDGSSSEINEKNIGRLSMTIITKITEAITPKIDVSKKKLSTSSEQ